MSGKDTFGVMQSRQAKRCVRGACSCDFFFFFVCLFFVAFSVTKTHYTDTHCECSVLSAQRTPNDHGPCLSDMNKQQDHFSELPWVLSNVLSASYSTTDGLDSLPRWLLAVYCSLQGFSFRLLLDSFEIQSSQSVNQSISSQAISQSVSRFDGVFVSYHKRAGLRNIAYWLSRE